MKSNESLGARHSKLIDLYHDQLVSPYRVHAGTTLTRRNKDRSPGPGKYNLKAGMLRSGSYTGSEYTMRIRPGAQKSLRTPGPNAYKM